MKKLILLLLISCVCVTSFEQTIYPRSTIMNWFKTGDKPTSQQYYNWMNSYWHKLDSLPFNMVSGFTGVYKNTFLDSLAAVRLSIGIGGGGACAVNFGDINGSPNDNIAITTMLSGYQPILQRPGLLDTKMYYHNGNTALRNFADDVRAVFNAKFDSSAAFTYLPDSINAILQHGVIPNLDSVKQWGGWWLVTPSTRGTKPASGTGFLLNLVQQTTKYTNGSGRVAQILFMHGTNRLYTRNGNDGVYGNWDTIPLISDLSGSGLFYPITGGRLAAGSYFGLPKVSGSPYPVSQTGIHMWVNGFNSLAWGDSTGHYIVWRTDSSTGPRNYYLPDINNATITALGNVVNAANGLVRINSSGYLPALDARNLINVIPSTGLSVSGGSAGQSIRVNTGGTAFEFYTPSSGSGNTIGTLFTGGLSGSTLTSGQTQYGYISGAASTVTSAATRTIYLSEAGALSNFWLFTSGTQDASGSLVATLYKNGSATSVVITIAASSSATSYSYTSSTISVSAGDFFYWKFQNNATTTSLALVNTTSTFKQ